MILVLGAEVGVHELPMSDIVDYQVESEESRINIKLKTVAKAKSTNQVFMALKYKGQFHIASDIEEKMTYFKDDDDLVAILENGGVSEETKEDEDEFADSLLAEMEGDLEVEKAKEEESLKEFEITKPIQQVEIKPVELVEELEEVAEESNLIDGVEDYLIVPTIGEMSEQKMRNLIDMKERILEQKNEELKQSRKEIDDLYKVQEMQLIDFKKEYDKKIDEANSIIRNLNDKVSSVKVSDEDAPLVRYLPYYRTPKALVKEGFTRDELLEIGHLKSNITILAGGVGDSTHNMLGHVNQIIQEQKNVLIVDFSNEYYLLANNKIMTRDSSLLLNDDSHPIENYVKTFGNTEYIPTTSFNDIALLGLDWVKIIKKLNDYAQGKQIILLFGGVNNFNVRYTVSKLATIGQLYVVITSNPINLLSTQKDLAFIPKERVTLIVTKYDEIVKTLLERLQQNHELTAVKDKIDWYKLGLNM